MITADVKRLINSKADLFDAFKAEVSGGQFTLIEKVNNTVTKAKVILVSNDPVRNWAILRPEAAGVIGDIVNKRLAVDDELPGTVWYASAKKRNERGTTKQKESARAYNNALQKLIDAGIKDSEGRAIVKLFVPNP
jgi:hypothetical protein